MDKEKSINKKNYDWVIVGSGIAGIVICEILTRMGHSVLLIEKNKKLASETTRDFHEWIHTGALYTLIPDNLYTLKFLLGSIDDLLEFYSDFDNMNLIRTEKGLKIKKDKNGWFNDNHIHFKFRVRNRKITFPWLFGIARSSFLLDIIKNHDWLRRRAGEVNPFKLKIKPIIKYFFKLLRYKKKFFEVKTSDFTANSRNILNDLINNSIKNGLKISLDNEFINFSKNKNSYFITCKKNKFECKNIVFTNGANISKIIDANVKLSYAPIAIVNNLPSDQKSYVELDYFPKNCINIITKENGIGQIGGISFSDINKCDSYLEKVIKKHKIYNPKMKVLHKYNGVKAEIIIKNQPRNYLYHILDIDENVYGIIPGKFTLGFSIAPEFYRKIYKKNPDKIVNNIQTKAGNNLMSNTVWQDVYNNNNNN